MKITVAQDGEALSPQGHRQYEVHDEHPDGNLRVAVVQRRSIATGEPPVWLDPQILISSTMVTAKDVYALTALIAMAADKAREWDDESGQPHPYAQPDPKIVAAIKEWAAGQDYLAVREIQRRNGRHYVTVYGVGPATLTGFIYRWVPGEWDRNGDRIINVADVSADGEIEWHDDTAREDFGE